MNLESFLFNPRSIAIAGASSNPDALANRNFLQTLLAHGYKGRIYPINPKVSEIMGLRAYPSIRDVPEPVDYAICAIPAPLTPGFVQECSAAHTKVVAFYSAGFSETGLPEGLRLEQEISRLARLGGVRLVGPNCLGVHSPLNGVSFEPVSATPGRLAFISQSGGNARDVLVTGAEKGLQFDRGVSYGNAVDLNESDFFELFGTDDRLAGIAAYIEGIKEPGRFRKALAAACRRKPVVVVKGGTSEAGSRAVASHTGSLAGSSRVWDGLCRQAGAIQAGSLDEMTDILMAFRLLQMPAGNAISIVGAGGGAGVKAADVCEAAGLKVPAFPPETREELVKFTPLAGVGLGNPLDTSADVYWDTGRFSRTIQLAGSPDSIDMVCVILGLVYPAAHGINDLEKQVEAVLDARRRMDKPIVVVLHTGGLMAADGLAHALAPRFRDARLPVFLSVERAARVLRAMVSYGEFLAGQSESS